MPNDRELPEGVPPVNEGIGLPTPPSPGRLPPPNLPPPPDPDVAVPDTGEPTDGAGQR